MTLASENGRFNSREVTAQSRITAIIPSQPQRRPLQWRLLAQSSRASEHIYKYAHTHTQNRKHIMRKKKREEEEEEEETGSHLVAICSFLPLSAHLHLFLLIFFSIRVFIFPLFCCACFFICFVCVTETNIGLLLTSADLKNS